MIASDHFVTKDEAKYRNYDETLLSKIDKCTTVTEGCVYNDHDGNDLVYDGKLSVSIHSGMAEVGMVRRWKEYTTSSMLLSHDLRSNTLYSFYPDESCAIENIYPNSSILGKFQDIKNMIGIGILRNDIEIVIKIFDWSAVELHEL